MVCAKHKIFGTVARNEARPERGFTQTVASPAIHLQVTCPSVCINYQKHRTGEGTLAENLLTGG